MEMKYGVRFKNIEGEQYLVVDSGFAVDETLQYAIKHNFNVYYDCCNWTDACDGLYKFQEQGYSIKFVNELRYPDVGIYKIVAYLTKEFNNV